MENIEVKKVSAIRVFIRALILVISTSLVFSLFSIGYRCRDTLGGLFVCALGYLVSMLPLSIVILLESPPEILKLVGNYATFVSLPATFIFAILWVLSFQKTKRKEFIIGLCGAIFITLILWNIPTSEWQLTMLQAQPAAASNLSLKPPSSNCRDCVTYVGRYGFPLTLRAEVGGGFTGGAYHVYILSLFADSLFYFWIIIGAMRISSKLKNKTWQTSQ